MSEREYAAKVGGSKTKIGNEIRAARVFEACPDIGAKALTEQFYTPVEIHAAPEWLWPAGALGPGGPAGQNLHPVGKK